MTTAGGFPVLHIPEGWACSGWLLHPVFRQPHCCGSSPEPTGAHVPHAQRWVGAPPGLVCGQFFVKNWCILERQRGGWWQTNKCLCSCSCKKNQTTGILCCKLPLLEWRPVLLSWSKAEHDSLESGKFIVWKSAKAFGKGISPDPVLWTVNNSVSIGFIGSRFRYQQRKSSQENCSEWTPASHLKHNLSVFLLRWFWPINLLFVLFLFGFVCSTCLFVTSLQEKPQGGAGGRHPYHVFSLRLSTKVCSPNTKCENDVSITKAFSQRGWAVIWNKLIFSWEESKSLEVLFF